MTEIHLFNNAMNLHLFHDDQVIMYIYIYIYLCRYLFMLIEIAHDILFLKKS